MTDKTAAELEREAEAARARVFDTAESIRGKMTPGQLIDEFTGLFSGGESAIMLHNFRAQLRDNPLPLTLVGTGLAWLMLGNGKTNSESIQVGVRPTTTAGGDGGGFGEMLSGAAGSVADVARSAGDSVSNMAADAADQLASTATQTGTAAGDMAVKATRSAQEMLQDQPLALAAVGLALGAAIGAILPHTAVEDEQLGAYGDKIRNNAEAILDKGLDEAKQVATDAYETASQGAGHGGTLTDQIGEVVKVTVSKTEQSVRERLAGSGSVPKDEA